jgi:hypothetical protein
MWIACRQLGFIFIPALVLMLHTKQQKHISTEINKTPMHTVASLEHPQKQDLQIVIWPGWVSTVPQMMWWPEN